MEGLFISARWYEGVSHTHPRRPDRPTPLSSSGDCNPVGDVSLRVTTSAHSALPAKGSSEIFLQKRSRHGVSNREEDYHDDNFDIVVVLGLHACGELLMPSWTSVSSIEGHFLSCLALFTSRT
jgi:hypothetical protein